MTITAEQYMVSETGQRTTILIDLFSVFARAHNISPDAIHAAMTTRTYRVQVLADGRVSLSSWGLAKDVEHTYDSVDGLPAWMQRKIAALMIFDPVNQNDNIAGLGRRISKGTFWLYPDEGEDDGNDSRAPRKSKGA